MLEQLKKYWAKVGEHPFLKHLFIIVCVLLVLGVATHLLLLLGTRHSAHRTVPDLTGIPLEEALGEARRQGLEIIVNDSLYVPAYDGGVVLDQLPEKGVGVKPGRTVYVTINSYRQKMVTVPYVAGRSLRQAKNMLEVAGLAAPQPVSSRQKLTTHSCVRSKKPLQFPDLWGTIKCLCARGLKNGTPDTVGRCKKPVIPTGKSRGVSTGFWLAR